MVNPHLYFDFVRDRDFRESLQSDYRELAACAESASWKAMHVLAGSIIEAVLVDYLVGNRQTTPDPLKMSLGDLITAGQKAGILSQRTAELSAALKSYRNLIHPGRAKRLGEVADAEGATVAASLVSIIVKEVAAKQREVHGYTAEQLVTKFETDSSAAGIAEHIFEETQPDETERLLLTVLPNRYFVVAEYDEADPALTASHTKLFRAAFDFAPKETKEKVMSQYVSVLKREAGGRVRVYEEEFFRASDLQYASPKDRALVKAHLFSQLDAEVTRRLLAVAKGVGRWLVANDVMPFFDALLQRSVLKGDAVIARLAKQLLIEEARRTPKAVDPVIIKRLDEWVAFYAEKNLTEEADVVKEVKAAFDAYQGAPGS